MTVSDDDIPAAVDQSAAEVNAHADVADTAVGWAAAVMGGDVLTMWALLDDPHRLAITQSIIWANRDDPLVSGYGERDEVAAALTGPGCIGHPLWPVFAEAVLRELRPFFEGWQMDALGFMSRPRPVTPGHELVMLGQGRAVRTVDMHRGEVSQPILMRHTKRGWLVARVGADTLPVPGWPPMMPPATGLLRRLD